MRLIFSMTLILLTFSVQSRSIFSITYKNDKRIAKKFKSTLINQFSINEKFISISQQNKPCEKFLQSYIQICVLGDEEFKVFDWSGNKFKSIKPLLKKTGINL